MSGDALSAATINRRDEYVYAMTSELASLIDKVERLFDQERDRKNFILEIDLDRNAEDFLQRMDAIQVIVDSMDNRIKEVRKEVVVVLRDMIAKIDSINHVEER